MSKTLSGIIERRKKNGSRQILYTLLLNRSEVTERSYGSYHAEQPERRRYAY
jgi:hypothetical protein